MEQNNPEKKWKGGSVVVEELCTSAAGKHQVITDGHNMRMLPWIVI